MRFKPQGKYVAALTAALLLGGGLASAGNADAKPAPVNCSIKQPAASTESNPEGGRSPYGIQSFTLDAAQGCTEGANLIIQVGAVYHVVADGEIVTRVLNGQDTKSNAVLYTRVNGHTPGKVRPAPNTLVFDNLGGPLSSLSSLIVPGSTTINGNHIEFDIVYNENGGGAAQLNIGRLDGGAYTENRGYHNGDGGAINLSFTYEGEAATAA